MSRIIRFFISLAAPKTCYQVLGELLPWTTTACLILITYGSIAGLFWAPADYQQGEAFRIIYVHVPCAILSLSIYTVIFLSSVLFLVWRIKIADRVAEASGVCGATFTLIALITGAIWGKPIWGTFWVWDARLTAELILLFLYSGYLGLRVAYRHHYNAARAAAILAIVGMVDIPIVHFSVEWWETLHQGATITRFAKPTMATEMLYPLLAMIAGFALFYLSLLFYRMRSLILYRERQTQWVQALTTLRTV
jgi:heme exporter protein C